MGLLSILHYFLCPCHRSDDEYNVCMGVAALESLQISLYVDDFTNQDFRIPLLEIDRVEMTVHIQVASGP